MHQIGDTFLGYESIVLQLYFNCIIFMCIYILFHLWGGARTTLMDQVERGICLGRKKGFEVSSWGKPEIDARVTHQFQVTATFRPNTVYTHTQIKGFGGRITI